MYDCSLCKDTGYLDTVGGKGYCLCGKHLEWDAEASEDVEEESDLQNAVNKAYKEGYAKGYQVGYGQADREWRASFGKG